jgi:hypothetical protein
MVLIITMALWQKKDDDSCLVLTRHQSVDQVLKKPLIVDQQILNPRGFYRGNFYLDGV